MRSEDEVLTLRAASYSSLLLSVLPIGFGSGNADNESSLTGNI
jgi:hypothetical protein